MKDTCNNFVLLSIQITIVEFGLNKSSDTDFRTLPCTTPSITMYDSEHNYVRLRA